MGIYRLFHCHMFQHMIPAVVPKIPGLSLAPGPSDSKNHLAMHDDSGMGQLVRSPQFGLIRNRNIANTFTTDRLYFPA
jgi:hypothetical protein